jgi:hypothetical protein
MGAIDIHTRFIIHLTILINNKSSSNNDILTDVIASKWYSSRYNKGFEVDT